MSRQLLFHPSDGVRFLHEMAMAGGEVRAKVASYWRTKLAGIRMLRAPGVWIAAINPLRILRLTD